MRSRLGVLVLRFTAAAILSGVALLLFAALDRSAPASMRVTLLVLPASIAVGFLPLLYWYRRDAYPIGMLFAPAAYYWLRFVARTSGLSD